jgi:hypothetical protein
VPEVNKGPKLKLTHRNIRARYAIEKRHNPKFSHASMAEQFMVDRQTAYKWCRIILDDDNKEIVDSARNPLPSGGRAKAVLAWLNDGVLINAMKGK